MPGWRNEPRRDQGFALLLVLWSLVLITLLMTALLASGRTSMLLAGNIRAAAMARAAADGAVAETIFHLLGNGGVWAADGAAHQLVIGQSTVIARVHSLGGKINPNLASTALLAGLFQAAGLAPVQARELAAAVIAWRSPAPTPQARQALLASYRRAGLAFGPPGKPFADLAELGGVLGMSPALLAAVSPYLSLEQSGDPDAAQAGPMVREALKLSGQAGARPDVYEGNAQVVTIEAEARGPGRVLVRRHAIVSLPGALANPPYRVLALTDDEN